MMGVDTEELTEAGRRLNSFAIHLLRAMRRVDAESGLTPARLSALSVLHFGGPRPLGRLARDEDVTSATMCRLVDALFMRAYMRRLITERNAILTAELEGPGRTLSA